MKNTWYYSFINNTPGKNHGCINKALFVIIVVSNLFVFDRNCDITATADFRSGQSLSAGTASASSEEIHFLRDLQLLLFPLES
ncbi:hypothetical protein, partial [Oceanobacillus massiliensis]|uniref:hypothetical protein n=1 Tax=Oceanobacillus massiliensis TaxID=1465765 RepID=UPI0030160CD2